MVLWITYTFYWLNLHFDIQPIKDIEVPWLMCKYILTSLKPLVGHILTNCFQFKCQWSKAIISNIRIRKQYNKCYENSVVSTVGDAGRAEMQYDYICKSFLNTFAKLVALVKYLSWKNRKRFYSCVFILLYTFLSFLYFFFSNWYSRLWSVDCLSVDRVTGLQYSLQYKRWAKITYKWVPLRGEYQNRVKCLPCMRNSHIAAIQMCGFKTSIIANKDLLVQKRKIFLFFPSNCRSIAFGKIVIFKMFK